MASGPKLIFINIENTPNHIAPLAAFGYMAAFLKERLGFHSIQQLNMVFNEADPLKKILDETPDIVGFRTITTHIAQIERLSRRLALEYGIPVLWGGPHITSVPKLTPDFIDCAVIGDGEETIVDLMRAFLSKGRFDKNDLSAISGITFWKDDRLHQTPARPQLQNLNSIPCPDYTICDEECFRPRERWLWLEEPVVGIPYLASRGCAFRCIFCQPATYEGKLRLGAFDKVFQDLQLLKDRHGAEVFALYDPIFANHAKRVREFREAAEQHGLEDSLFYIQLFARNFSEEMALELSRLRMYRIFFGLESGSERILKYLKNGVVSMEDNLRVCRLSEKYGLRNEGAFMIGVPGETEEDLELTRSFIEDQYLSYVQISHTVPQPGTRLWAQAEAESLIAQEIDWDRLEPKDSSPEIDDLLVYLNPAMPKTIYRKHSEGLYATARRKTRAGSQPFLSKFRRDLSQLRKEASPPQFSSSPTDTSRQTFLNLP